MTVIPKTFEPAPADLSVLGGAPVPRIRIEAFCEAEETAEAVAEAGRDRRMLRTRLDVRRAGIRAAIARYGETPSPDLILVERQIPGDVLLEELEKLAEVCDADTKVIVIGASNDVRLYRDLLSRGVSDYLVGPIDAPTLIGAVGRLYAQGTAPRQGRTYAFVGAKGGVGASTVAHNVAAAMADGMDLDVVLADLDLAFGTAGLDFNLDTSQSVVDALDSGERLDEVLFERLLGKCSDRLRMLAAPATLDRAYDLGEEGLDRLLDTARANCAHLVLDLPHMWSGWARRTLVSADEVVICAAPDLANLRNTKNLVATLLKARPHDPKPHLVLNQAGMSRRPEIKPVEFARAVGLDPVATIAFDAKLFGTAANNGQMISDVASRSAEPFRKITRAIVDNGAAARRRRAPSLLSRLARGRAGT